MESRFKQLEKMNSIKPSLYTCLSPSLLHLYDIKESIVVIIDVLRATSTIATALYNGANQIITGSFPNISAVCDYLVVQNKPVILGCAAWKDRVNIEDTLFAGAVISRIKDHFDINCDASNMAATMYAEAKGDLYEFMKNKNASHYHRLTNYGLEKDIRYCLANDGANVLCFFDEGKLVSKPK